MIRLLLFALLFTIPATADDVFMNNTTSESNMCVIGITGQTASTPSAVAHANWSPITYNCAAGTYLPADGIECVACPSGKYCEGGQYTYNETTSQGITGDIIAGYYSSGGASTATGSTCLSGYSCGNCATAGNNGRGANGRYLYSNAGASSCTECPAVPSALESRVTTYYGWWTNNIHNRINGCAATFSDTDDVATFDTTCFYSTDGIGGANSLCQVYNGNILACAAGYGSILQSSSYWNENYAAGRGVDFAKGFVCGQCAAGTYSAAGDTTCTPCPSAYPLSDAGTGSVDYCYVAATCPVISGATACDPHAATCAYTNDAVTSGRYYKGGISIAPTAKCIMDFTCSTGYTNDATQNTPTLPNQNGSNNEYHSHNNNTVSTNGSSLPSGGWSVIWDSGTTTGTMAGISSCNDIPGNRATSWAAANKDSWILPANTNLISTSTTGRYCWCKPTTWTLSGGNSQNLSAVWVFVFDDSDAGNCAGVCALHCADGVRYNSVLRSALFGTIGNAEQCTPATYSINYVLNGGSILPSGYTQLEYLEATGGQYIDTGITFNNNIGVKTKFNKRYYNGDDDQVVIGVASAGSQNNRDVFFINPARGFYLTFAELYADSWVEDTVYGVDYEVSVNYMNDRKRYLNGTSVLDIATTAVNNSNTMYLFAGHLVSSQIPYWYFGGRIYYAQITNGTSFVRNFIPVRRNSDNVLGMYDTVTGTFFTNSGTGTFTAGPDTTTTPTSAYTYDTGTMIDFVPTRTHSSFVGWCTDVGLTNCAATQTIGTTATGDKTFYAKYLCDTGYSTNVSNTACNANTITVNWDNGAGGATQNTCTYGGDLTTPTTPPTKRGHVFTGWTFNLN